MSGRSTEAGAGSRPHRPRPTRRTASALLGLVSPLLVLTGLLSPVPGSVPTAAAAEPDPLVRVSIDSMTPSLLQRGQGDGEGSITLAGTVTNVSKRAIVQPQALFWRSRDPITDRDGLDHALASSAIDPYGERLQTATSVDDLWTNKDRKQTLPAGASVRFSVTASVADLELPAVDGVYLIGVHLREAHSTTVGRARAFLPVTSGTPRNTVTMASLVLLRSTPALLTDAVPARGPTAARLAVFTDDHLADEVAPGGRLDRLLDLAARPDASFAVDPELIAELEAMADGYQVRGSDGDLTDGDGGDDAENWLNRFDGTAQRSDGFRLPYGSPDLAALAHGGQTRLLRAVTSAGDAVDRTADLPLLALPTAGMADSATLTAAGLLQPRAYLLSDDSADGAGPLLSAADGRPVVTYSAASSAGGPGPDPRDTPVLQRQAFLASSWIDQAGTEPGTSLGSVRLIDSPRDGSRSTGAGAGLAADAPWLERTTVSALLAGRPGGEVELSYTRAAARAQLTRTQVNEVSALADVGDVYDDLVVDDDQPSHTAALVARATSGAWRGDELGFARLVGTRLATLSDDLDTRVTITGGSTATLTGRNNQHFPLTVTNNLDVPIAVRLHFSTPNPQRIGVKPSAVQTLQPGESYQFTNEAVPRANGSFPVVATLRTEHQHEVGANWSLTLVAADVGFVGWLIVLASGATLVGATAFRIRQVAGERRGGPRSGRSRPSAEPAVSTGAPGDPVPVNADPDPENPTAADRTPQDRPV